MKKFGTNKKNPNPAWPCTEQKIIVPPGSNNVAIGANSDDVLMLSEDNKRGYFQKGESLESRGNSERDLRLYPIMNDKMYGQNMYNFDQNQIAVNNTENCVQAGVANYLCSQIGKYVKIEFLFGENTHMEKIGRLSGVGKDFIAITENGTNSTVVCSVKNVKFVNIYEFNK